MAQATITRESTGGGCMATVIQFVDEREEDARVFILTNITEGCAVYQNYAQWIAGGDAETEPRQYDGLDEAIEGERITL